MSKALVMAKGVNGQIELYEDRVLIRRKGVMAFVTQGIKGDKSINVSSITSVQFKEAGLLRGYIQFGFIGGAEAKGGIIQGGVDENTVMFVKKEQPDFEKIRNFVQSRIQNSGVTSASSTSSDADQLEKFANLRDRGILSEEEFQAQKNKILGGS